LGVLLKKVLILIVVETLEYLGAVSPAKTFDKNTSQEGCSGGISLQNASAHKLN